MSRNEQAFSAAPNFAFDLTARRTSDAEMRDLAGSSAASSTAQNASTRRPRSGSTSGSARSASDRRWCCPLLRPGRGDGGQRNNGHAPVANSTPKNSRWAPRSAHPAARRCCGTESRRHPCCLLIVDPEPASPCPDGTVGDLDARRERLGGLLAQARTDRVGVRRDAGGSARGQPATNWLRTGDRGFISEDELFIVGGSGHADRARAQPPPEDIEATVQKITCGRWPPSRSPTSNNGSGEQTEQLVTHRRAGKKAGGPDQLAAEKRCDCRHFCVHTVCRSPTSSWSEPSSIPTTTSGKIRRSACVEQHRQAGSARLDA